MLERDMRGQVVKMLRPLHGFAVENGGCHPGTPDIAYVGGWIECKAQDHWPAREDTPVKLDHPVTPQQKIFALKHAAAGGTCWILVTIAGVWMLFDGVTGARVIGDSTREELEACASRVWYSTPKSSDLIDALNA